MRAGAEADEVVRVRVGVAGELVPVARELRQQRPPLGVLFEIAPDDEERRAHAVAREQLGEARQAAAQDREARRARRRLRERVDAVVAGDRVEIDGHAEDAIAHPRHYPARPCPTCLPRRAPI